LQYALDGQSELGGASWDLLVTRAQADLNAAQSVRDALVEGYDTEEVAIKKKQVEAAEISLSQAQKTLDKVADDVAKKELEAKLKEVLVVDAQKALEDSEEAWEEAKSKSPVITAPFAGFITNVNVEGGDEILRGTVALQLADPEKFEADIMVSEMDILQVKLGGEARVQVDAMQGMSLPADVIHISPTASIQSGVVNYNVKVEVQSLESAMQEQQSARQETMQNITSGELPDKLKQAIESGQITQEQAEEMMKQALTSKQQPGQARMMIPEDFQLREGLTVTVSIIVDEATDVLLVPNAAITSSGSQSYVQVQLADGTTEERAIQTGISDWQFTEVTEGLSEGEQIAVPQGATATTSRQGSRPSFFMGGGGAH